MQNTKEFYDFVSDAWHYVKTTKAPRQDDDRAWEQIIDHSNELCREFTVKMADWMEYLREESKKHEKD